MIRKLSTPFHALVLALAALSCSKDNTVNVDDTPGTGTAQIGAACVQPGDCESGVCIAAVCRQACKSSNECGTGKICLLEPDSKLSGCSLPAEQTCNSDGTCPNKAFACGIDGRCRTSCVGACSSQGSYCVEGACFGEDETEGSAPGVVRCVKEKRAELFCDGAVLTTCNAEGKPGWVAGASCGSAELCNASVAASQQTCVDAACKAGDARCNASTFLFEQCASGQAGYEPVAGAQACATYELCEQGLKSTPAACPAPACNAGESRCRMGAPEKCNKGRTEFEAMVDCVSQSQQCNPMTATCSKIPADVGEVTRARYAQFLTAQDNNAALGGVAGCGFKSAGGGTFNFTPDNWTTQQQQPNLPVTGVDWCDAYAFCAWNKQHLCGKIGGGMLPYDSFTDPGMSEWMNHCTSGGEFDYPYGDQYQSQACNDAAKGKTGAIEGLFPETATEISGCKSPRTSYPARNMLGNVSEWENACSKDATSTGGQDDECRLRGGDNTTPSLDMAAGCMWKPATPATRKTRSATIGFRCCGSAS